MFTENKYTRWYFAIVEGAQTRQLEGYVEEHHIVPKSMGGTDCPNNLVTLTAREHFICHLLLTRMVTDKNHLTKMQKALRFMMSVPKKMQGLRWIPTGRTVEIAKREAAKANRGNREIAAKISKSHVGKILAKEHRAKIGAGLLAAKRVVSDVHKEAISKAHKNKPKSDEAKEKMRLAWVKRRERISRGLEKRKPYSQEGLSAILAGIQRRTERARATKMGAC